MVAMGVEVILFICVVLNYTVPVLALKTLFQVVTCMITLFKIDIN